jgi:serine/threonine protein kinase
LPISVAAQIEQLASPRDFLKFLGVVQQHEIDVFPITWHPALDTIGEGATAEIRAALIDLQTSYAFKRYIMSDNNEEKLLLHLISEVSILGLESIRNHPNIIKLEGVAWDINNDGQVWPVLVFEKAEHGDLETFFASNPGKDLTFEERLDLCIHIGTALMVLRAHSKSYKVLIQSGRFPNNPRKM